MSILGNLAGNKAVKEHRNGNFQNAEKMYREALKKGMDNPAMLLNFASLLVREEKYDEALDVLRSIEKNKGLTENIRVDMHIQYAIILWKKGHLAHAIEILEEDLRHVKTTSLYSVIGYLKIENGNAEEALRINLEALEYDNEDAIFLDNVGQVYFRLFHDRITAKKYFEKAIHRRPESIDTNYFLSLYDIEDGNLEKAKERLLVAQKGRTSPLNYASPQIIKTKLNELSSM